MENDPNWGLDQISIFTPWFLGGGLGGCCGTCSVWTALWLEGRTRVGSSLEITDFVDVVVGICTLKNPPTIH